MPLSETTTPNSLRDGPTIAATPLGPFYEGGAAISIRKKAWTGPAVLLAAVFMLAWTACRGVPNDGDKIPITISVDLAGIDEAWLEKQRLKQTVMPAIQMPSNKIIDTPEEEAIHLKITITGPEEVFYVWNFNGSPVTITVGSGEGRAVEVEGYRVPETVDYNEFPAEHLITLNPLQERTLDLSGQSEKVKVEVGTDPAAGVIVGGTAEGIQVGGTTRPLPVSPGCPPEMYAVNISDKGWGIVFPSIPVDLDYGSQHFTVTAQAMAAPSFYVDYAPRQADLGIRLWHYTGGFYKEFRVFTGDSVTSTGPFVFEVHDPHISVKFSPETLQGITVGSSPLVMFLPQGGMGAFVDGELTGEDTCGGNLSTGYMAENTDSQALAQGPSVDYFYEFDGPAIDDCTISVTMEDCGGGTVTASMEVDVDTYCGDGYCNGTEDGEGCPQDCDLVPDGMADIPGGCFDMGDHFNEGETHELPLHQVCITSFYMDVNEVTNAEYADCVNAGACTPPGNQAGNTRPWYYGNQTYVDHPVIYVDWQQAGEYCAWSGKRLPTEAEWEYAARGGLSGSRYFDGDNISCSDANYGRYSSSAECWNYDGLDNDTHAVGSYPPNGYGLFDVAGNVWEWTGDWYGETYYSSSPLNDPPGPSSGDYRVMRGGCYGNGTGSLNRLRVAFRESFPSAQNPSIGFRCAKSK